MRRILVLLVVLPGCSAGMADMKTEVDSLRAQVIDMSRSNAALRKRIDDMENRLLLLQDQVETQRLATTRSTAAPELPVVKVVPPPSRERASPPPPTDPVALEDAYQVLDDQGRVVGQPARAEREPNERPRSEQKAAGALEEYKAAYALYEAGRLEEARRAFEKFVARYPKHPYADNAQYWVGECYYDQKDYESARREFMRVVQEHPDGNKVPDAMVKVGLCNQMLRRSEEARRMYNAVVLTYPDSQAAVVALRLIGELP